MNTNNRHRVGSLTSEAGGLIDGSGRRRARVGPWTCAGLLAGGGLGCGYGLLVGVAGGLAAACYGAALGGAIGLITGPLIGFIVGLAQLLLRRTAIGSPVIAVAVTELILLPLQVLAAGADAGRQLAAAVLIYIPSLLGVGAAAAVGFLLSPARRPRATRPRATRRQAARPQATRRAGGPDPGSARSGGTQPFGATGLRLLAVRRTRRLARRARGRRVTRPDRR